MAQIQAAVIGLIALIITPGWLFYFDVTPKLVVLLAGTAVAAAAAFLTRGAFRAGGESGHRTGWISVLVALSLVALTLSTAFSSNAALSLFGGSWRRYGAMAQTSCLLFAWLAAGVNAAGARTILRGIAVAGLISGGYGIAQYFGWDPLLPAAAYHIGEGTWTIVRPPGTLGYASYFATWLLFAIFFSWALASSESSAAWRRTAAAAAVIATAAMLLTGTRAAMAGFLAGGAIWLYWRGYRVRRRTAAVVAAVLLAGTAFYFSPPGWQMRSRARWFAEDPWGGARPHLWLDSLRMAEHRLVAGYGPEVFMAVFPRFESRELARAYPDFAHESPHNMFLDTLVSQGVLGLLPLCGFCAAGFAAAWRLRTRHEGAFAGLAAGLAAALAAGIVSQQFTVFIIPTALMFYTSAALAMGLAAAPSGPAAPFGASAPAAPPGTPVPAAASRAPALAAAPAPRRRVAVEIAITALCLALLYLALRFTIADRALAAAQQVLQAGNVARASAEYAVYERWRLPGTAADLWFSRSLIGVAQRATNPLLRFQALAQSGAAAMRATGTAEDPFNAWYNAAALAASQNDAAGAERYLRAAIAANPNWFKPHWVLAQVLLATESMAQPRWQEAEREAALAADLNGGKNPEVARTLEDIRSRRVRGGAAPTAPSEALSPPSEK